MSPVTRSALVIPSGYASQEVASFIAQLEDLLKRQRDQTRRLTPADLEWQPAPGMNTIGMLMAHQAIIEAAWTRLGIDDLQLDQVRVEEILGIGIKDDGMPLPEDGAPPASLAGKDLAFYDDLMTRAREYLKRVAVNVKDSDLTIIRPRTRPNGEPRELELRWMIHFMVGHFASHFGQIQLLQHAHQAMKAEAKRS
jgi:Protein of unknown function (DUF664)